MTNIEKEAMIELLKTVLKKLELGEVRTITFASVDRSDEFKIYIAGNIMEAIGLAEGVKDLAKQLSNEALKKARSGTNN
jgi:formyltetrahydrofolate synthetase